MTTAHSTRVFVIDSCAIFVAGLGDCLQRDGFQVFRFKAPAEARRQFPHHTPDVAVIGPHVPVVEGLAYCRTLVVSSPAVDVLLCTPDAGDVLLLEDAADAGVALCLPLESDDEEWRAAVHKVLADHRSFACMALQRAPAGESLSAREREVLRLLAEGCHDPEIARQLGLSPATVRNHVQRAIEKLQVNDRHAAVARARRRGWL